MVQRLTDRQTILDCLYAPTIRKLVRQRPNLGNHTGPVIILTLHYFISSSPACKIEVPERLTVSHQALIKCGLADRCVHVPVRQATDEEILLVHRFKFLLQPSRLS